MLDSIQESFLPTRSISNPHICSSPPLREKLLNELDRVPSSKSQTTLLNKFKYQMVDPIKWSDESQKWEKIWQELFLKR